MAPLGSGSAAEGGEPGVPELGELPSEDVGGVRFSGFLLQLRFFEFTTECNMEVLRVVRIFNPSRIAEQFHPQSTCTMFKSIEKLALHYRRLQGNLPFKYYPILLRIEGPIVLDIVPDVPQQVIRIVSTTSDAGYRICKITSVFSAQSIWGEMKFLGVGNWNFTYKLVFLFFNFTRLFYHFEPVVYVRTYHDLMPGRVLVFCKV